MINVGHQRRSGVLRRSAERACVTIEVVTTDAGGSVEQRLLQSRTVRPMLGGFVDERNRRCYPIARFASEGLGVGKASATDIPVGLPRVTQAGALRGSPEQHDLGVLAFSHPYELPAKVSTRTDHRFDGSVEVFFV